MSREQSLVMKGVAILLMLYLHLFYQYENAMLCVNTFFIGGEPLSLILTRASNPVDFFLILGGYGLYRVYEHGDHHRWVRIFKLFLHYWVILLIFLIIGHYLNPERYPGSWLALVYAISSFAPSYDGAMWFLFPYVCLSLLSPLYFRLIRHRPWWAIALVTFVIYMGTSWCISRHGQRYLYDNYLLYNPLLVLHLLFCFTLGALAARDGFFNRMEALGARTGAARAVAVISLAVLITVNCVFHYNFLYAFMVMTCLLMLRIPVGISRILSALGRQSMNMWMIHMWLCGYLFKDFIYSFRYPALILTVLVLLSYGIGLVIDSIARPVEQRLLSRAERKASVAV